VVYWMPLARYDTRVYIWLASLLNSAPYQYVDPTTAKSDRYYQGYAAFLKMKYSPALTRKIPPRVSVVRDECIDIHELRNAFGHAIGDTGDHHPRVVRHVGVDHRGSAHCAARR
jgi:hypothetical protein